MALPGKWLENSEFISKQKAKGAEADQISPGYLILKESTVVPKEWKQTTWKPHGLVGGSLYTKLANFHRGTSRGTESKPMFVFKGQSNILLQSFPETRLPCPHILFCENVCISLLICFNRIC